MFRVSDYFSVIWTYTFDLCSCEPSRRMLWLLILHISPGDLTCINCANEPLRAIAGHETLNLRVLSSNLTMKAYSPSRRCRETLGQTFG